VNKSKRVKKQLGEREIILLKTTWIRVEKNKKKAGESFLLTKWKEKGVTSNCNTQRQRESGSQGRRLFTQKEYLLCFVFFIFRN